MSTRGVIYSAVNSNRHAVEARKSAASVRKIHPDIPIAIHTDKFRIVPEFDIEIPCDVKLTNKYHPHRAKIEAMKHSPFDETIYLDTDTELRKPVDHVFELFPDYDLALSMAVGKSVNHPDSRLDYLSEYNTGVMFWKKTRRMDDFFDQWLHHYDKNFPAAFNDQFSFTEVVHHNAHVRIALLTVHYNQRHPHTFPSFTEAKMDARALVIHNRNFIA